MRLVVLLLCIFPMQSVVADEIFQPDKASLYSQVFESVPRTATVNMQPNPADSPPNLRLRNSLIIVGTALVAAYGAQNWWRTGFGGGFDMTSEGWFGAGTRYGGADKLGHLYSNYAGVRLLTPLFESVGNSRDASVSLAAWSTFGIYTAVEVVDGFSRNWKFSPQDAISNAAGATLGIVMDSSGTRCNSRFPRRLSPLSALIELRSVRRLFRAKVFVRGQGRWFRAVAREQLPALFRSCDRVWHARIRQRLSLNLARLLADGAYDGRMHSTAYQRGTDRLFDLVQFPVIGYVRWSLD